MFLDALGRVTLVRIHGLHIAFYAYTSYTLLELLTPLSVSSSKNPPASGGWNEI